MVPRVKVTTRADVQPAQEAPRRPPKTLEWTKDLSDDFNGLGLSSKVIEAVTASGYTKPTEIQAQAIPIVLQKKDLIGIAQTGTGKTAAFVLPMLTLLESGRARARMPRTLILEPTRELAAQVHENFEKYGKNHKLSIALLIGGVSFDEQNRVLDRGADVLIATPGRLLDQFERGRILMNGVDILVIDEADRMLDMGFIPDIEKICGFLPARRQTLFFSATMPPEIRRLTKAFLKDPVEIQVARQNSTAETIDQKLARSGNKPEEKREVLRQQLQAAEGLTNAIIFCNRKRDIATLARSLERHGFSAGGLHGDMDQKSRTETLEAFKANKLTLLVASDVAARGLDIPAVSHVFNFDVPVHAEDYVHRIGRTGRAGRAGTAITLVTPSDSKHLEAVMKLIQKDIPYIEEGRPARNESPRLPREEIAKPTRIEIAETPKEQPRAEARPPRGDRKRREPGNGREPGTPRETGNDRQNAGRPSTNRQPANRETPVRKDNSRETEVDNTALANRGKAERYDADSPFGSDGPVPAFLLRSTARAVQD
ncbi:MAG: box helicase [Devosia sp.]|nr:box helicase [Devosia sp.]